MFKIFKIMRLRKSKDNQLEFRKKLEKDIHNFNFEKFILFVIKQVKTEKEDSGEDNDLSEIEEFVSDEEMPQNTSSDDESELEIIQEIVEK